MSEALEIVFYIHGVSPDRAGKAHVDDYLALHRGVAQAVEEHDGDPLWPMEFDGLEWGWNFDQGECKSHKQLADAQRVFWHSVNKDLKKGGDQRRGFTRRIVEDVRELIFHGFGDMFYYVSTEGKWAVRNALLERIHAHIKTRRGNSKRPISLTLLGHSAGAVIAFDFLYYLFSENQNYLKDLDRGSAAEAGADDLEEREKKKQMLGELREWAHGEDRQLRLRRLITFGSPISFLMFRSDTLLSLLAANQPLHPANYGLESCLENPGELDGPRWINLWDRDDPIAWPIESICRSPLAQDIYVDVSDSFRDVHNDYWRHEGVFEAIAKLW